MRRILIAIVAITLVVDTGLACSTCGKSPQQAQKRAQCQSVLLPKNLKGTAYKSEWNKCMQDPYNYK
jgi:hypothetical protein